MSTQFPMTYYIMYNFVTFTKFKPHILGMP